MDNTMDCFRNILKILEESAYSLAHFSIDKIHAETVSLTTGMEGVFY